MYFKHIVDEKDHKKSAEFVLRNRLNMSRKFTKKIRHQRGLTVNGNFALNKDLLAAGDLIEVNVEEDDELIGNASNPHNIEIIFEDEWYLVINKPPFISSHPKHKSDIGINTIMDEKILHAANRLDTDTSGLMVLTKNSHAHDRFSKTPVNKIYLALVHGEFPESGLIDEPIGREEHTIIFRKVREDGQSSQTYFERLAYWPKFKASLVAFKLATGRTHQIRVHSRYINHPLVGDNYYGWEQTVRSITEIREGKTGYYLKDEDRNFTDPSMQRDFEALALNRELKRQFLHAYILEFTHPLTEENLFLKANLYNDLDKLINKLQAADYQKINSEKIRNLINIETEANVQSTRR